MRISGVLRSEILSEGRSIQRPKPILLQKSTDENELTKRIGIALLGFHFWTSTSVACWNVLFTFKTEVVGSIYRRQ